MEEIIVKTMEVLSNPQVILVSGLIVEFGLRFKKTEKPLSIIRGLAVAAKSLGKGLIAVAEFSDKVIGQRLK